MNEPPGYEEEKRKGRKCSQELEIRELAEGGRNVTRKIVLEEV